MRPRDAIRARAAPSPHADSDADSVADGSRIGIRHRYRQRHRASVACALALALLATAACGGETPAQVRSTAESPASPWRTSSEEDAEPREVRPFVIDLWASGRVRFKNWEFDLGSGDPGEQDDAIQALQDAIREACDKAAGLREKRGACKLPLLVRYEPGTPTRYLQWIRQACAHPDIKIYDIRFVLHRKQQRPVRNYVLVPVVNRLDRMTRRQFARGCAS